VRGKGQVGFKGEAVGFDMGVIVGGESYGGGWGLVGIGRGIWKKKAATLHGHQRGTHVQGEPPKTIRTGKRKGKG